jgi:hypothetical protein
MKTSNRIAVRLRPPAITVSIVAQVVCGAVFAFSSMAQDFLDYAGRIALDEKYFDVSRLEIRRLLLVKGRCELLTEHEFEIDGRTETTTLRLNIITRGESALSWSMSLKLHGIRIDGLDHEGRYKSSDGSVGRGWHRHEWDADESSAERRKIPAVEIEGVETRDDFLIRGFSVMRIRLNAIDHGQELLLA